MRLVIDAAQSDTDFADLHALRQRMAAWDVAMSQAAGLSADDVLSAYYALGVEALRQPFERPGARVFLARLDGQAVGSLGFSRWDDGVGEIQNFFVAETARGQGAGRALLNRVLATMPEAGYQRACLETAPFMTAAIALYRAAGFQDCPPFRPPPPGIVGQSLFMDRAL